MCVCVCDSVWGSHKVDRGGEVINGVRDNYCEIDMLLMFDLVCKYE